MNKEYESYLQARNKSTLTIGAYLKISEQFHEIVSTTPKEVTITDIQKYKLHMENLYAEKKYSANTLVLKYYSLRTYLQFLKTKYGNTTLQELEKDENVQLLTPPPQESPDKETLTKEEALALINSARENLLHYAILNTLYYIGQRKRSVVQLNIQDIDWNGKQDKDGFVYHEIQLMNTKGRKNKLIEAPHELIEALKEYLATREKPQQGFILDNYRRQLAHKDALFLNGGGGLRLNPNSIDGIVTRYAVKTGLK